jgi:hypothetical protein
MSRTPLHGFVPSFGYQLKPDHEPFGPDDLILFTGWRLMSM